MTEEEISNLIINHINFPEGYPADFELNNNLLEQDFTILIPNVFPGGITVIDNMGFIVSLPQKEEDLGNNKFGTRIDFKPHFFPETNSDSSSSSSSTDASSSCAVLTIEEILQNKNIKGWKIRYNRGIPGDDGANGESFGSDEDLIKFSLIF